MNAEIRALIRTAWHARLDQNLEEVYSLKASLRVHAANSEVARELQLLEASLARATGRVAHSNEILAALAEGFQQKGEPLPERWLMESGLNHFYGEDFARAADDFLAVISRQKAPEEMKVQARLNAKLCFEYLNVPSPNLDQSLMDDFSKKGRPEGLHEQWQALQIRRRFACGEWSQMKAASSKPWSQTSYLVEFYNSIPYVNGPSVNLVDRPAQSYLRSFRARTLAGQSVQEDLQINKTADLIERLYLWTWRRLANTNLNWTAVDELIANLQMRKDRALTPLSRHMFRAAVEWRANFDSGWSRRNNDLLSRLRKEAPSDSAPPLFEMEYLVQNGNESLWRAHANKNIAEAMKAASQPRAEMKTANEKEQRTSSIVVDLSTMEIRRTGSPLKIHSEPMARALHLLKREATTTCAEFMLAAFGQKDYDPYLHASRMFNLIARLRQILPAEFNLNKRSEFVRLTGPVDSICVLEGGVQSIVPLPEAPTPRQRPAPFAAQLSQLRDHAFTRQDLERRMQKSRATVNRVLDRWMQEGLVTAQGSGPARKYIVTEKWRFL